MKQHVLFNEVKLKEKGSGLCHTEQAPERTGQVGSQASHSAKHSTSFASESQESKPAVLHFWDDVFIHISLHHPAMGENSFKNGTLLGSQESPAHPSKH